MTKIIQRLFDTKNIPDDANEILNNFDKIVQGIFPANSKQLLALPKQIRELSHLMTDDRESRRLGYMNDKTFLFAYTRYFMWWNLVRLTRLFSNLDFSFLQDGSVCLDVGSGPLTVITALWLARPELRQRKLTWYAMDISQQTLNFGEEIYLAIASRTMKNERSEPEPWKIIRVRGQLGAAIKEKAAFVSCANVFNEILQGQKMPPDALAKKYSKTILPYLQKSAAVLLVEPGVPHSARFVSLMRDAFLRKGFFVQAPCPHAQTCPMDGRRQGKKSEFASKHRGANGKWCNFAFETSDAPKKLLSLSKQSDLPKERAVLSFVFAVRIENDKLGIRKEGERLRIASDPIRLPENRRGFYACSEKGFTLAVNKSGADVASGDLVLIPAASNTPHDAKTGARIVDI